MTKLLVILCMVLVGMTVFAQNFEDVYNKKMEIYYKAYKTLDMSVEMEASYCMAIIRQIVKFPKDSEFTTYYSLNSENVYLGLYESYVLPTIKMYRTSGHGDFKNMYYILEAEKYSKPFDKTGPHYARLLFATFKVIMKQGKKYFPVFDDFWNYQKVSEAFLAIPFTTSNPSINKVHEQNVIWGYEYVHFNDSAWGLGYFDTWRKFTGQNYAGKKD